MGRRVGGSGLGGRPDITEEEPLRVMSSGGPGGRGPDTECRGVTLTFVRQGYVVYLFIYLFLVLKHKLPAYGSKERPRESVWRYIVEVYWSDRPDGGGRDEPTLFVSSVT